jgi:hypothetical protein
MILTTKAVLIGKRIGRALYHLEITATKSEDELVYFNT